MGNQFTNIITEEFKTLHKNMIDSLLESTALTVPCRINYKATKTEDCPNCIYDSMNRRSSNIYQDGGPIPFTHGMCPYCNGVGILQLNSEEIIYLMPIWSSKDWYNLTQSSVNLADISVQTMSKIETYAKLKRATSIVIDTTIEKYGLPEFVRVGDPEICGLGTSTHIITSWKRS
jgi:hypothetical protein